MSVLKPYSGLLTAVQRALDAGLIAAGLFGASIALDHEWTELRTFAVVLAIAVFLIVGEAKRLYGSWRLGSLEDEFRTVFIVWAVAACAVIVAAFLAKVSSGYSRLAMVAWFLIVPALLLLSRLAVRTLLYWLRRQGRNMRTVCVASAGSVAETIVARLLQSESFGVRLVGVFDDRASARIQAAGHDGSRLAGTLKDLVDRARQGEFDYVFIALPIRAEKRIVELVGRLADTTASVYMFPDLFTFDLMRARWTMLGGLPAVSVYETPFEGVNGWLKRAEDLVLGTLCLAVAAVPMLVITMVLKINSRDSVFFLQRRYGLNGRVLRILKFRTMTLSEDGSQISQLQRNDPRITPFGRFLRATSLDELPQLFNVLSGEMTLVGPRPHAVAVNEQYRRLIHGYMLRHKVKPGITGWAQVNGWHGDDTLEKMQKRVEHDLEYVQNWSLWLDLTILLKTVLVVFSPRSRVLTK